MDKNSITIAKEIFELSKKSSKAMFLAIIAHEKGYDLDDKNDLEYLEKLYDKYIDSSLTGFIEEDFEDILMSEY